MLQPNHSSIPYDCRHDLANPDHLVCVARREKIIDNPITCFFFHRYHRHYHRRHRFGVHHLVADILILGVVAGLLALNVTNAIILPTLFPRIVDLIIATSKEQLTSGQEVVFRIHVANTTGSDLRDVRVTLHASPLFTNTQLTGPDTVRQFASTIYLGDIKHAKHGEFVIRTTPVGPPGSHLVLGTTLEYSRTPGSDPTKEDRRFLTTIGDSVVRADLSLPSRIPSHQRFAGTLAIEHGGDLFTRGVAVISAPKSFTLESFGGKKNASRFEFELDKPITVPFTGRFAYGATGTKTIQAHIFALHEANEILQTTVKSPIVLFAPPLSVGIDPADAHQVLLPGRTGSFKIRWENTSPEPIRDAVIGVKLSGDLASRSSLTSPDGTVSQKGVLVWTKNHKKNLGELPPGKKGFAEFSFQVKQSTDLSKVQPDHDFRVTLQPFATYTFGDNEPGELFDIPLKADVATSLHVSGGARYFTPEGEQIGRGPLPPRVGRETRYAIALFAKAGIHPVSGAIMTARLGAGVSLSSPSLIQSKDIRYDTSSRTIVWTIPSLPPGFGANSGVSKSTLFELAVKPTPDMAGRAATLLYDIRASGIDATLDTRIESGSPDITTLLSGDPRGMGKGVVRQ